MFERYETYSTFCRADTCLAVACPVGATPASLVLVDLVHGFIPARIEVMLGTITESATADALDHVFAAAYLCVHDTGYAVMGNARDRFTDAGRCVGRTIAIGTFVECVVRARDPVGVAVPDATY